MVRSLSSAARSCGNFNFKPYTSNESCFEQSLVLSVQVSGSLYGALAGSIIAYLVADFLGMNVS